MNDSLAESEEKDDLVEEKGKNGEKEERTGDTSTTPRRTCKKRDKRIPNWILKDMEFTGKIITMYEGISVWGNLWLFLGWKFCPYHLSLFADHMRLVEVSEVERLNRLRTTY